MHQENLFYYTVLDILPLLLKSEKTCKQYLKSSSGYRNIFFIFYILEISSYVHSVQKKDK